MGPKLILVFPTSDEVSSEDSNCVLIDPSAVRALRAFGPSWTRILTGVGDEVHVAMPIRQVADALGWVDGAVMATDRKKKWQVPS